MSGKEDKFLQTRVNDYDTKFRAAWKKNKLSFEPEKWHLTIRSEIFTALKSAWKSEMGKAKIPADLEMQLATKLHQKFKELDTEVKRQAKMDASLNDLLKHMKLINSQPIKPSKPQNEESNAKSSYTTQTTKEFEASSEYALGIDLGTTMCCVAVKTKDGIEIVQNRAQGSKRTTPSYVKFADDGSSTYGYTAKDLAYRYTENTIFDAKRMIGRQWLDPQLQNDRKLWPFEVVNVRGTPKIKIGSRTRLPHEVSARLLSCLRGMAEESLHVNKGTIKKAVVTVPAYFSEPQRRATIQAAEFAGLEVLSILSEPTAAALTYKFEKKIQGARKALIYDLGGGTFDVSIAEVKDDSVEILCVHGDTHLGGQDIDQLIMTYCLKEFQDVEKIDLMKDRQSDDKRVRDAVARALGRLRAKCEGAKEQLATSPSTIVDVDGIYDNRDLSVELSIETFNQLCKPLIQKSLEIVDKALEDAKEKGIQGKDQINDVILVGGSTRIPLVESMLQEHFKGKLLCKHVNPDEAVAVGAAIQADILKAKDVHGNTINKNQVNDVTPLNIGIECEDDEFCVVIPRNQKIPCSFEEIYSPSIDHATRIQFRICQGDSNKASQNVPLGEFIFEGIQPALAGKEKIKVKMAINADGILEVKAVSMSTYVEIVVSIDYSLGRIEDEEAKEITKGVSTR